MPNRLYKKSAGLKIELTTFENAPEFLEPPSYPFDGSPGILYLYDLLKGMFFASISRYPVNSYGLIITSSKAYANSVN